MSPKLSSESQDRTLEASFNVVLFLGLVILLFAWCFVIVRPFLMILLGATILAVALRGVFAKLVGWVGGRRGLAGTLFAIVGALLIIVPAYVVGQSLVGSVTGMREALAAGTLQAPPPPENLQNLPFVGERAHEAWMLASDDVQQAMTQFEPQLRAFGGWLLGFLAGVGGAVLRTLVALLIAAALLTYSEPCVRLLKSVGARIPGGWDEDFVDMAAATIDSVAKGVLGIALIQAALCGIGFFVAGIPAAGLFTLAVLIVATIQVPALIIVILPIIWAWSNLGTVGALVFTIYSVLATASDLPLKPLLLGRGVPVPSGVILAGAIGGMVSMGLLGLFVGAVVLGIGYTVFNTWLQQGEDSSGAAVPSGNGPEPAEA